MTLAQSMTAETAPKKKRRSRKAKAKATPKPAQADTVQLPDSPVAASVFATLAFLALEGKAAGYSGMTPFWKLENAIIEDKIKLGGESLSVVLQYLLRGGYIVDHEGRKSHCFLPTYLDDKTDDDNPTRKRTNKAERSSARQREVAALIERLGDVSYTRVGID